MTKRPPIVPNSIREALDGLPWSATYGSRHIKIYLGPRLVTILPRGNPSDWRCRSDKNCLAAVKRAVREYREQQR